MNSPIRCSSYKSQRIESVRKYSRCPSRNWNTVHIVIERIINIVFFFARNCIKVRISVVRSKSKAGEMPPAKNNISTYNSRALRSTINTMNTAIRIYCHSGNIHFVNQRERQQRRHHHSSMRRKRFSMYFVLPSRARTNFLLSKYRTDSKRHSRKRWTLTQSDGSNKRDREKQLLYSRKFIAFFFCTERKWNIFCLIWESCVCTSQTHFQPWMQMCCTADTNMPKLWNQS